MKLFKILGRLVWVIIAICAVAVVTCVMLVFLYGANVKTFREIDMTPEVVREPEITGAQMRVLFAGTTFWGRRTNTDARASELGVKYPFSQLDTLDRASYDAWIGGLECPVTDNGHNKSEEETIFKFNCDPDYLPEAAKYFTAFLLGNNHTGNQGKTGLATTRNYLTQNGIQYFGTPKRTASDTNDPEYANDDENINNCDIVVLPVRISLDNGSEDKYQIPFGFCSAHGVYGVPGEDYLQNMKTFAQYVPTIAMPHMGAEYKTSHDTIRQNLYRKMIDYGVEAVIGDHPHWLQDAEAYKDKLIVYSMGNFMFDQTFNVEVTRSAAIEANAVIDIDGVDLQTWNELGEQCLADKTTCFEKITRAELTKLSIDWTYDYHGTTSAGNRITRLASESEQTAIGARLNWNAIPASLKVSK